MNQSPFNSAIQTLGPAFEERAGWEVASVYTDVVSEYKAATTGAAVLDLSYVGRLKATGDDALDLLNRLSTNNVVDLGENQGAPTILTTDRGRILDLIYVANTGDYALIITSPGTQQTVIDWLDKYTIMEDLVVEDITGSTAMLALMGPNSPQTLLSAGIDTGHLSPFQSMVVDVSGCAVRIINHPLGILANYHFIVEPGAAGTVWDHLAQSGATPTGLTAYEAVRVAYGIPAYGQELGESYNPLEAGLVGSVDFAKGCYIGQEVIARLDTYQKVQKNLVTLRFSPDSSAMPSAKLLADGQPAGSVTSVSQSPDGETVLGLGFVRKAHTAPGTRLELEPPSKGWAEVQEMPLLFGAEKV